MSSRHYSFGFNTLFQRELILAWSKDLDVSQVRIVGLRPTAKPNSDEHAETALRSARRIPSGRIGTRLKRLFLRWQYNWIYRFLERRRPRQIFIYNGFNGVNYLARAACEELDIEALYFERAPFQDRIQIDSLGVNFQSSIPRDTKIYRTFEKGELTESRTPRQYITRDAENVKSYPKSDSRIKDELRNRTYLFCPLQVPRDTQVTVFGGWIGNMPEFLIALNEASRHLPKGMTLRIKEHPSSPISFSDQLARFDNHRLVLDNQSDTGELIAHSQGVITVNSSVGLEAFLFDKPVITLGQAFYSFADLALQASSQLRLNELMADIENLSWNQDLREKFIEYLNFWFPPLDEVMRGEYTPADLKQRDRVFKLLQERAERLS